MKNLVYLLFIIIWMSGIVIASGFWSTFFSIIFPFWAFYLFMEVILVKYLF